MGAKAMRTTTRHIGRSVSTVGATVVITMLLVISAVQDAAAVACGTTITSCGCTLSFSGTYTFSGNLSALSGTCIDITASNVVLQGFADITGPGSTSATIGIHIEPSANRVLLNNVTVESFGTGVRIDGPNAAVVDLLTRGNNRGLLVDGVHAYVLDQSSKSDVAVGIQINATATDFVMDGAQVEYESGAGIKLNGVGGAFLEDTVASYNGTFGIWLESASNNHLDGFIAEGNQVAGIYLGCNPTGPNGTACAFGVPSSASNTLDGSVYGDRASLVNGATGIGFLQAFGIAVGRGNLHNRFLGITGAGNSYTDALDENPDCGSNRWFLNSFTASIPTTNTTFFCLN